MKITLTCLQRLNIEALISARELKTLDEQIVAYELLKSVRMDRQEKEKLFLRRPDGAVMVNEELVEKEPAIVREMPDSQIEELKKLLSTAKIRTSDVEWLLPLKRDLENGSAAVDIKKHRAS
jgi:hypothetical protein